MIKRFVVGFLIGALIMFALARDSFAQEVVLQPGDTLTVVAPVPAPVVPETVYVEVPVPGPPIFECPDGWTCTEDPPPIVEIDSIPPLGVSGLMLALNGNVLTTNWRNRPDPDRGGVGTDGYQIHSGNDATGEEYLPRDTVASSPHRRTLTESGRIWTCVRAFNAAGLSVQSCDNVVYELPPEVVIGTYLLSVAPEPYSLSGDLEVVEGDYSIHLDRTDGAWSGLGDVVVPGVDSVVFCSGGVCNPEGRLPYELGGGTIPLEVGRYEVSWEVFGDEPDSGSSTVVVNLGIGAEIPSDSVEVGLACEWGEDRCRVVGETIDVRMEEGQTLKLYSTVELPDDPRVFVVLQDSYAEVEYDPARGWICLKDGGDTLSPDELGPPVWEDGATITAPRSCA